MTFEFGDIHCFQDEGDPARFYYLPGTPVPEADATGRPTLLLFVSDDGAILQLGSQWKVDPDQLAALQAEILRRHPELNANAVRLSQAAVSVDAVVLQIGDGHGEFTTLQTSSSSGYPPFTSLFQCRLNAGQKEQAVAALNGRTDFLKIVYQLRSGESSQVTSVERTTDLSTWFRGGSGSDHVKALPVTLPPPVISQPGGGAAPIGEAVLLDFDATELPVACVELTRVGSSAGSSAVLKPPVFQPVVISGTGTLTATTRYTSGAAAYQTTLSNYTPEGWKLTPSDLGIQLVSIEGGARRAAGAKEIRIHLTYRPLADGSSDDRTLYFNKDTWRASFFLVTRSPNLNGVIAYEWKETAADGSAVFHPLVETKQTNLTLM